MHNSPRIRNAKARQDRNLSARIEHTSNLSALPTDILEGRNVFSAYQVRNMGGSISGVFATFGSPNRNTNVGP
jgi:hypothetical protein